MSSSCSLLKIMFKHTPGATPTAGEVSFNMGGKEYKAPAQGLQIGVGRKTFDWSKGDNAKETPAWTENLGMGATGPYSKNPTRLTPVSNPLGDGKCTPGNANVWYKGPNDWTRTYIQGTNAGVNGMNGVVENHHKHFSEAFARSDVYDDMADQASIGAIYSPGAVTDESTILMGLGLASGAVLLVAICLFCFCLCCFIGTVLGYRFQQATRKIVHVPIDPYGEDNIDQQENV